MKKKLFPILLLVLMLVFVGCSTTQLEFWTKSQEVNKWPATTVKGDMSMKFNINGGLIDLDMTLDGLNNAEDKSSYTEMSINFLLGDEKIQFDQIKVFVKDNQVYVSKNYLAQILELAGEKVPDVLLNDAVEYICFKEGDAQAQVLAELSKTMTSKDEKEIEQWLGTITKNAGINVDITKAGNTYSMNLNEKDMLALVRNFIVMTLNELDTLNEVYGLNISGEDVKSTKANLNEIKEQLDQMLPGLENLLKGNVKVNYTFEDNQVSQKVDGKMSASIPNLMNVSVEMSMNMVSEKTQAQVIALPDKVLTMTQEELVNILTPQKVSINKQTNQMVDAKGVKTPCQVLVKDNQTFVMAKATLGALGQQVIYNEATKQVGITTAGSFKPIQVITEKGTAYISLDTLKGLGYSVTLEGNNITIQ